MRTTIDIDDDVLLAAKDLARRQRRTAGEIVSELARLGLNATKASVGESAPPRYGFAPKPASGAVVTNAQIDALRDAAGED